MTTCDSVGSKQSANITQRKQRPSVQDRWSPRGRREGETYLAYKLRQNGIATLNKKGARSYKKAVFWNQKGHWFVKAVLAPNPVFIVVSLLAMAVSGMMLGIFHGPQVLISASQSVFLSLAGMFVLFCGFSAFFSIVYVQQILVWRRTPFYLYPREIPPAVHAQVEKAKPLCSGAEIWIEHLGRDPLVAVHEGGEKEYIGAWNEQGLFDFDV